MSSSAYAACLGPVLVQVQVQDSGAGLVRVPSEQALEGARVLLLFFSASWCSPCRAFLPRLLRLHAQAAPGTLAVVLVSSDTSAEAFGRYLAQQPWWAVPMDDAVRNRLQRALGVASLPSVVALDHRGNLIPGVNRDVIARHPPEHVLGLLGVLSSQANDS